MSAVWDLYQARMDVRGVNQRTESLKREKHTLLTRLRDNLSYQVVNIDGIERTVAIINTDNLDTKKIYSLPNENLHHGGIVDFADNKWLITEKDAANEVYTRAVMRQCNYLLRWVNDKKQIVEQWSIVEDGTKYLTGEYGDRNFVIMRGDTRLTVTLAITEESVKLGREHRFLIDDPNSPKMMAYALSKPLKLGSGYNGEGVYRFVLQEVNFTEFDNQELRIADYYRYFPTIGLAPETSASNNKVDPRHNKTDNGTEVLL